jgi:hypothetical protein
MLLINASANVELLRNALRPVATLAVIPDWIFKKRLWKFYEAEKLNSTMELAGYTSRLM